MEVISSLANKVVFSMFDVAKIEITDIRKCAENVGKFKSEAEKLSIMKRRIQQQIDLANSKGEVLLEGVGEWMKKSDATISDATDFINEEAASKKTCFNLRLCVNLSTLRHYSKTSAKKTVFLQQHQGDGKEFETRVSLPTRAPGFIDLYQRKKLENIDTHRSILKEIIEAIEDDTIQMVGIIGIGGVGKTTLASEVAAQMKNQFADIVFLAVSQTVDAKMIQEKVQIAASRLINGEKVLIILDDIWEELKLDELGIPCGSDYMNCKILLTSRSEDVCEAMNAQKIISVNPLQEKEGWALFEIVIGKSVWDDKSKKVALEIVKECGGLPLFIQAVGKALKNKEINLWEKALRRLQDPTDEDASFKRKGIMQLKLSYDYLESEVVKSCFLLCSMFPEDRFIDVERLTYYGFCLGIFNNSDSIQVAKDRVLLAIESLKSSSLLLHIEETNAFKENEEHYKLHDIVRDMALFITSKGNDMFLVHSGKGLVEWKPRFNFISTYKKASLMNNKIRELPDYELLFPHLDTFLIQDNNISIVPDEFFHAMEKLIVLDMAENYISSLPQSVKHLTKLRMLDLSGNKSLGEIFILGKLTCLEILKLRNTGITNIPKEIGQLIHLRLLDVYSCKDLSFVTPGVISKLIRLEELYVGLKEGNCDFLVELSELKIKILHLRLPELHSLPTIETLTEFDIGNSFESGTHDRSYKRWICISKSCFPFETAIMKLIPVSEVLLLSDITALNSIIADLYREDFDELKFILLEMCDNITSLVKTSDLDVIQTFPASNKVGERNFFSQVKYISLKRLNNLEILLDRPHQYISFCNLVLINIEKCPSLTKLFPVSVAQGLVSLEDLYIVECESLVEIISVGDEEIAGSEIGQTSRNREIELLNTDITLPLIAHIFLYELPKLESFFSGHSTIKYPSFVDFNMINCPNMKRWSYGENHTPNMDFDQERTYSNMNDFIAALHEMKGNFGVPLDVCAIS